MLEDLRDLPKLPDLDGEAAGEESPPDAVI